TLSETPEGNLKWLAATSTAGTSDRLAAAKATFSTESADSGLLLPGTPSQKWHRVSQKLGRFTTCSHKPMT
ncbi:hypothetical protein Q8X06_20945, partial [Pseudomonas aeruginosa]|uniref:hypothetical protein n=1 Tax=Pseudomonas aeruginosa TaxID=287 RepID=UPI0022307DD6